MPDYRLYFVGGRGHFKSVSELVADDDGAAIAAATLRRRTVAMEIWSGARKVRGWARDVLGDPTTEVSLASAATA